MTPHKADLMRRDVQVLQTVVTVNLRNVHGVACVKYFMPVLA